MSDLILITGGTGKTGSRLAGALREGGLEARIASRSASGEGAVRFDWRDATTFGAALDGASAVYLVAPTDTSEQLDAMRPFLNRALETGMERFVLLSASSLETGGPMMGAVDAFLRAHAPQWMILRPTWFAQNFSEGPHRATIRDENAIYSATDEGRVPFIDAADIAAVAATALAAAARPGRLPNREAILTGPQTLSYDEVAAVVSQITGRTIKHHRLSESELTARYESQGLPPQYAPELAKMDTAIARGAENRVTDEVKNFTGHPPTDFRSFAMSVREVW